DVRSGPGLRPDPDPSRARDRRPGAPVADVLEPPQEIGAAAGAGRFVAVADQPGVVGLLHGHGDPFAALRATAELGALPGHDEAPFRGVATDRGPTHNTAVAGAGEDERSGSSEEDGLGWNAWP